jgi:transposase
VKLDIAVDVLGFPYAACVTTANITDRAGAVEMFKMNGFCPEGFEKALVDGGYTGDNFAKAVLNLKGAVVEVAKRSELHKFVVIPKRWIVEGSFGWLDKCRILWKNCERYLENTLSLAKLAFLSVLLKRF